MIIHVFNSSLVSGPETLVLPALRKLSEPVEVVFLSELRRGKDAQRPVDYAKNLGLTTVEIPVRSRIDARAIRELRAYFQRKRPSIVHAHDVKASTYALSASLPTRQWKLISTHHSVKRPGLKLKAYERFYSSLVLRGFDLALTVSTEDRDILISRGFPAEKIRAHLNGVDRREIKPENRTQERAKIHGQWKLAERGISSRSLILGIAARLDPEKNHRQGLEVFSEMAKLDPRLDWKALCFGVGPLRESLERETQSRGLQDRVHWMGYHAGLGDELAGLDLLLSFSRAEGLPINILEAGWAGTPLISLPEGGIKDVLKLPSHGVLLRDDQSSLEIAETIIGVLKDPSRRDQLGRGLQQRVIEAFSEKSWLAQLELIYSNLK